jgi:hypothetical protein
VERRRGLRGDGAFHPPSRPRERRALPLRAHRAAPGRARGRRGRRRHPGGGGRRAVPRRLPGRPPEVVPGLPRQGQGRPRPAHPPALERRAQAGVPALGVPVRDPGPRLPGALLPHSRGSLPGARPRPGDSAGRAAA